MQFNISLDIEDDHFDDVIESISKHFGWHSGSGLTKAQTVQAAMIDRIKQIYSSYKATQAAQVASQSAFINANSVTITKTEE